MVQQQQQRLEPSAATASITGFSLDQLHVGVLLHPLRTPGSKVSKTADEAASTAASEAEACGEDVRNAQYCNPWDKDPSTGDLPLQRTEEQRNKSPTPAHATPAAKGVPSTNEMDHQRHIYEMVLGLRLKRRGHDQSFDRRTQSPVIIFSGLQQQLFAGTLYPVPSSSSSSEVSAIPGRKGDMVDATTASEEHSSSYGSPVLIPATRDHGLAFKEASAAIDKSHPLPWSPICENPPAPSAACVKVPRCSLYVSAAPKAWWPPQQQSAASQWLRLCPPGVQSITILAQPLQLFL
ncbi:hypothetical protein HPB49_010843 [Dermacentor silvarum]|uniref:Uncharacterized protein n=1 Tax=Dermacentor silvarum TaxID=543639 RepID=A0ACB8C346_DERSI|nr:hypothetical protein HPB49_010843 [Dermacentor silvarum]